LLEGFVGVDAAVGKPAANVLNVIGFGGLLIILWLMVLKPF